MSQEARIRVPLHACSQPPEPRLYLGNVDSEAMQFHAMRLYQNIALATRYLEAVRWLRSRRRWVLDEPKGKP